MASIVSAVHAGLTKINGSLGNWIRKQPYLSAHECGWFVRQGFFLLFRSGNRARGFCCALHWWEPGGVGGLRNRSGSEPNVCLWSGQMHIGAVVCTAWGGVALPGAAGERRV